MSAEQRLAPCAYGRIAGELRVLAEREECKGLPVEVLSRTGGMCAVVVDSPVEAPVVVVPHALVDEPEAGFGVVGRREPVAGQAGEVPERACLA